MTKRVHIVARSNGWAIKKEGNSKASKIFESKKMAVNKSKPLRKRGHDVIIHTKDGSIQTWQKGIK